MGKNLDYEKILFIIDMNNGFINNGALADKYIANIIPNIIKLSEIIFFDKTKNPIFMILDKHEPNSAEFNTFPKHCLAGSEECELVDEIKKIPYTNIFFKNSLSAIFNSQLKFILLNSPNLKEIVITGCCTDLCVLNFAIPAKCLFDENNINNIKVTVPFDCVETYESPTHNRQKANYFAREIMSAAGVNTTDSYF